MLIYEACVKPRVSALLSAITKVWGQASGMSGSQSVFHGVALEAHPAP